ncbi:hypothetical protein GGR51DRAFT_120856 [Nemania sp. FL0031]|nr:hypothetical protein GGR51DRAFT_120856 [Nemania sp. FL0031]
MFCTMLRCAFISLSYTSLGLYPANPRKKLAKPNAPGSGTVSNPEPPTYTALPRLGRIPFVPSAALFAAKAAVLTSPDFPRVSTNGYSASTMVRSPGLARVYLDRSSQPCLRASDQS